MDTNKSYNLPQDENLASIQEQVKSYLRGIVSSDFYNTWVDGIVIEKATSKEILVGYYGYESLKNLDKEGRATIYEAVCLVAGFARKFDIKKRKTKKSIENPKVLKNIRIAKFFVISMIFVCIALAFAITICSYIGNRNFHETFHSVSSLKVDNKVRVIQLTDLHNCSYGKENSKLIDRISKLKPDVIICTGDMLDSTKNRKEEIANLCSALADIAPSYYIYGNNEVEVIYDMPLSLTALDKKFGFNDVVREEGRLESLKDDFETLLEKSGVTVLKNESDTITVGTTDIDVYGVLTSNPSAFWPYSGKSFSDYIWTNPDNLKITAVHEPFIFEELYSDFWGDLMISGHTHGGHIRIPILGPLYTPEGGIFPGRNNKYVYSRYDVSGRPLIVSSGLDNTNIFRINNEPEVVIIDINKF